MDQHTITITWTAITLGILILFSGFFSAAEMVYTTLDISKYREFAHRKGKINLNSKITIRLLRNYSTTLNTILLGNNLANIAGTTVSGILFVELVGNAGLGIAAAVMTLFVLIFGEVFPKNLARKHPNTLAVLISFPIFFCVLLFRPVTIFFSIFSKGENAITSNPQQLTSLVKTMHEEGELEQEEGELIQHAIEFDEKMIRDVMVPWDEVKYVSITATHDEIEKKFLTTGFSRLAVLDKDNDKPVGVINFKEFFINKNEHSFDFKDIVDEPIIFSQYDYLSDAMDELKKERTHFAFVTLNKKSEKIIGAISLEDLLEEIVGEIYDESDLIDGAYETGHSKWLVNGNMSTNKFFTKYLEIKPLLTDIKITDFVLSKLPKTVQLDEGIKISWKNITFQVHEILENGEIEFDVVKLSDRSKI